MPHLPDDDGYEPPLKVLRKRLDGVYREDHGLSGPTRRYILMVALLVGLASIPTLAVITAGTSEITRNKRTGAMDAPFLPPPATGPVRPSPTPGNHSRHADPKRSPSLSSTTTPPGVSPGHGVPPAPSSDVDHQTGDAGAEPSPAVTAFPTVPGLPVVPPEDWDSPLARRAPAGLWDSPEFPEIPEVPEVADPAVSPDSTDDPDAAGSSDSSDSPDASGAGSDEDADDERSSSDSADSSDDANSAYDSWRVDPSGDRDGSAPHECEAVLRSTVIDRRRSRSRPSRRSAVTERPHVNAARNLTHSYGDSRNVRRSMTQPRSDENRITNRPYRGHHRAEHTRHDENTPARQRSSRVGRHHADPVEEHYLNHR
ncbi:hypothetical protein ACTOB_000082 [Actinoplanes oblitus]|uniref:Uncharacterized protein n=1 Tax=Actinoplanes oblitus TaxID=3040509 RepID=A0ABY8WFK9_9ACTN|nr:hypothetical protein [Actinoplanes oblitus]WIM96634.1 hypothetical protein ACTOB_000082 [Actinoplanes oblitus]